jgi:hypothetical protein
VLVADEAEPQRDRDQRLALPLQPLAGARPRFLDPQLRRRQVVDVIVDRSARQLAARLVRAQALDDLARRRQRNRRAVAQARLAQRHQDEEVLGRLVEREGRSGAFTVAPVGCAGLRVAVLRREHEEADRTLGHR